MSFAQAKTNSHDTKAEDGEWISAIVHLIMCTALFVPLSCHVGGKGIMGNDPSVYDLQAKRRNQTTRGGSCQSSPASQESPSASVTTQTTQNRNTQGLATCLQTTYYLGEIPVSSWLLHQRAMWSVLTLSDSCFTPELDLSGLKRNTLHWIWHRIY